MLTGWVATTATDSDAYEVIQGTDDDGDAYTVLSVIATEDRETYYCTLDGGRVKKKMNGAIDYLGESDDGVMKTGGVNTAHATDESYRFYFALSDSEDGEDGNDTGYTGNKCRKLYYDGMLITADDYR